MNSNNNEEEEEHFLSNTTHTVLVGVVGVVLVCVL